MLHMANIAPKPYPLESGDNSHNRYSQTDIPIYKYVYISVMGISVPIYPDRNVHILSYKNGDNGLDISVLICPNRYPHVKMDIMVWTYRFYIYISVWLYQYRYIQTDMSIFIATKWTYRFGHISFIR